MRLCVRFLRLTFATFGLDSVDITTTPMPQIAVIASNATNPISQWVTQVLRIATLGTQSMPP